MCRGGRVGSPRRPLGQKPWREVKREGTHGGSRAALHVDPVAGQERAPIGGLARSFPRSRVGSDSPSGVSPGIRGAGTAGTAFVSRSGARGIFAERIPARTFPATPRDTPFVPHVEEEVA